MCKNCENWFTLDKVITDYVMSCFYGPQSTLIMIKSVTEKVAADVQGHKHLLTSNRWKK